MLDQNNALKPILYEQNLHIDPVCLAEFCVNILEFNPFDVKDLCQSKEEMDMLALELKTTAVYQGRICLLPNRTILDN